MKPQRKRVYVSGPITRGPLAHNINQAVAASLYLLRSGFAPFCPHLSCYSGPATATPEGHVVAFATREGAPGVTWHDWIEMDLAWVAASAAVLRLPGDSKGADLECAEAERLGIPVYGDIFELVYKERVQSA